MQETVIKESNYIFLIQTRQKSLGNKSSDEFDQTENKSLNFAIVSAGSVTYDSATFYHARKVRSLIQFINSLNVKNLHTSEVYQIQSCKISKKVKIITSN